MRSSSPTRPRPGWAARFRSCRRARWWAGPSARVAGGLLGRAGLLPLLLARERHERPATPFRLHLLQDFRIIRRIPHIRGLMYLAFIQTFTYLGTGAIISVFTLDLLARQGIHSGPDVDYWVGVVTLAFTLASALSVPLWGRLLD